MCDLCEKYGYSKERAVENRAGHELVTQKQIDYLLKLQHREHDLFWELMDVIECQNSWQDKEPYYATMHMTKAQAMFCINWLTHMYPIKGAL